MRPRRFEDETDNGGAITDTHVHTARYKLAITRTCSRGPKRIPTVIAAVMARDFMGRLFPWCIRTRVLLCVPVPVSLCRPKIARAQTRRHSTRVRASSRTMMFHGA